MAFSDVLVDKKKINFNFKIFTISQFDYVILIMMGLIYVH